MSVLDFFNLEEVEYFLSCFSLTYLTFAILVSHVLRGKDTVKCKK